MRLAVAIVGYDLTTANLATLGPRINAAIAREVANQTVRVQRKIIQDKLTGQVLNVVTSDLRRSIQIEVTAPGPGMAWGEVFSNGTVKYAAIHEFGGVILPVHAKMLHWVGGDGAHHFARRVVMPERSFMRSTLREERSSIIEAIANAAQTAANQNDRASAT